MIVLFLISTVFAIICYRYNPKSETIRWGVFLLICAAAAGFSRAIIESILPFLNEYNMNFYWLDTVLVYLRIVTGFISVYFFPWAVLMHAITYSEKFSSKIVKKLTYILLIPIPFMLKTTVYVPDIIPDFQSMLYWAVPYISFACLLHLYAYFTEKDQDKKKHRFTTLSIILPVIMSALILNYIVRAFDITHQYWRYMIVFLVLAFFVFLWKALKEGAGSLNGIKLRYEREAHKKSREAINKGTSLLNHAIKNQVYKINSSLHIVKSQNLNLDSSSQEAINILERSSNHLMQMVERIHSQTQEIKIKRTNQSLNRLLDDSLDDVRKDLENKKISVKKSYTLGDVKVFCDGPQTKEVFLNVLKNAIEALEVDGEIRVSTSSYRSNEVIVLFSDNGIGISSDDIKHVIDPFFTTKGIRGINFGWGLTHCYEIMTKTGGSFEIESELNKGTTVKLTFPVKGC
jgi:signal transduction histidine kinase